MPRPHQHLIKHTLCAAMLAVLGACDLGTYTTPPFDGGLDAAPDLPPPNADPLLGCNGNCHGDDTSTAPPKDLQGNTDTAVRTVGAHRNHLDPAPTWHRKVACTDCHIEPQQVGDPGHADSLGPAELTFGAVATTGGLTPEWNGTTCANVYCHGATLSGGALTQPSWTVVDGTQDACGNCHGYPPLAPHPDSTNCGSCHPTVQPGGTTFLDPDSHIDGKLDLSVDNGAQGCESCHGGGGISAPPVALDGSTDRTSPGVGAHREHLGQSPWHRELYCSQCHVVPVNVGDAQHIDGDGQAENVFDALNPQAVYDPASNTCSNLYCHGNGRGNTGTMTWTEDVELGCNSCHDDGTAGGDTMSGAHGDHIEEGLDCNDCHDTVVDQNKNIIDPDLHVNGVHEIVIRTGGNWNAADRRCSNIACHGAEEW